MATCDLTTTSTQRNPSPAVRACRLMVWQGEAYVGQEGATQRLYDLPPGVDVVCAETLDAADRNDPRKRRNARYARWLVARQDRLYGF